MSLPGYAGYTESNIHWIGNLPSHWRLVPLKAIADFANGFVFKPGAWSEWGTPIVRIENLNGSEVFNYYDGDIELKHHVTEGDLLFGWSGNRGTSFGPFVWRRQGIYFLNQHIFKVRPKGCNAGWLYWCMRAVTKHVEDQATGIIGMVHVTKGDLGAIKVPVPCLSEQQYLATFLDRETTKIDALLAEQENLLALLAEKRQATISHAVTRGLDPNAPMKDSGIPWLGDVPAHWKVTQIKRLCETITDGAHISPETEGGVFPFVSTRDVGVDGIDFDECLLTSPTNYEYLVRAGCRPQSGDVLFSKDGTIGRTTVVRESREFVVASSLIIIRPQQKRLLPHYLDFLCQSAFVSSQVEGFVKGAGLPRLSIQNLRKIVGVFPPLLEQREIVSRLSSELGKLTALEEGASQATALLKERRSALIAAAVAGKIDVRGLVQQVAA